MRVLTVLATCVALFCAIASPALSQEGCSYQPSNQTVVITNNGVTTYQQAVTYIITSPGIKKLLDESPEGCRGSVVRETLRLNTLQPEGLAVTGTVIRIAVPVAVTAPAIIATKATLPSAPPPQAEKVETSALPVVKAAPSQGPATSVARAEQEVVSTTARLAAVERRLSQIDGELNALRTRPLSEPITESDKKLFSSLRAEYDSAKKEVAAAKIAAEAAQKGAEAARNAAQIAASASQGSANASKASADVASAAADRAEKAAANGGLSKEFIGWLITLTVALGGILLWMFSNKGRTEKVVKKSIAESATKAAEEAVVAPMKVVSEAFEAIKKRQDATDAKLREVQNDQGLVRNELEVLQQRAFTHVVKKISDGETRTLLPNEIKALDADNTSFHYHVLVDGEVKTFSATVTKKTTSGDSLVKVDGLSRPIPAKNLFREVANFIEKGGVVPFLKAA